jgi:hypothetical protein
MTMAMMGMAIVRVLALGLVMRVGVAIASVMTMAFVLVREIALEIASAALVMALAMVRAARLLVPQSAASRRSRWIVSEVLELKHALIPAPTSRRLYLH